MTLSCYVFRKKRGMNIWILEIVERESNRLVLYPVNDRSQATLLRKYCHITNKNHYSVFAINDMCCMDNSQIRWRTCTECKQCEKLYCLLFVPQKKKSEKSHIPRYLIILWLSLFRFNLFLFRFSLHSFDPTHDCRFTNLYPRLVITQVPRWWRLRSFRSWAQARI